MCVYSKYNCMYFISELFITGDATETQSQSTTDSYQCQHLDNLWQHGLRLIGANITNRGNRFIWSLQIVVHLVLSLIHLHIHTATQFLSTGFHLFSLNFISSFYWLHYNLFILLSCIRSCVSHSFLTDLSTFFWTL